MPAVTTVTPSIAPALAVISTVRSVQSSASMKRCSVSLGYFEFRRFEPTCDFGADTARTASRYFRSKRAHLPVKTIQGKAFAMLEGLRTLGSFALILLVGQI